MVLPPPRHAHAFKPYLRCLRSLFNFNIIIYERHSAGDIISLPTSITFRKETPVSERVDSNEMSNTPGTT